MFVRISSLFSLAALAGQASGQDAAPASSTQVFEPSYFARYSPTNALDMIQQVPGFTLIEGDSVRGFGGAAGNILINGERPSTKGALSSLLGRINTGSIIRIDLVTGASSALDMRGQTKVVNLIVREDALAQPVTYDFAARLTADGRITPQAQASTRRALFGGALNISGSLDTFSRSFPGGGNFVDGKRSRFDGAGRQTEFSQGFTQQDYITRQINLEYERDLKLFALRLNGAWSGSDVDGDRFWKTYAPDFNGPLAGLETNGVRNFQESIALGGDIERKFGDVDVKIITYNRRERNNNSTRFSTFTAPGALVVANTSSPRSKTGESILRGQLNWKLNEKHSIEFAAETAYNFVDNITGFTRQTPTSTVSFFVDGSDTKVEEFRNEFQISDVWTVARNLTIEPGFKIELSTIRQNVNYPDDTDNDPTTTRPDRVLERKFQYPKPSITATWRIQDGQQLRLTYKREVAQLAFSDFVSAADLVIGQTTTGNVNLVPQRAWALDSEFEQRFWKGGVLTLSASYDRVEDVQDFVKIGAGDGPGNIGTGTRWTVGAKATLPLDKLGFKGARIDAAVFTGDSEVTDPITGSTRRFSDSFNRNWSVSFRQDLPQFKLSYGFRWSDGGSGTAYRFNEISRRSREDPDVNIFVETTQFFGLRIRLGVDDLAHAEFQRTRIVYAGDRERSPVRQVERNGSVNGALPYVKVSGKF